MMIQKIIIVTSIICLLSCKKSNNFIVGSNKQDSIRELIIAIEKSDINKIEKYIENNPSLLDKRVDEQGTGFLNYCIEKEKYNAFKKLLELGANPNYINPMNKYSVLITSITPFGNDREWRQDNRYTKLLLKYKADPNYSTERTKDKNGYSHMGYSPLTRASTLNLEIVKELVRYGADINKRVDGTLPFGVAINSGKYDIALYYIDSLKVDLKTPLVIKENDSLFIQDLVINKFTLAKLKNDYSMLDSLKKVHPYMERDNEIRWSFIKNIEKKGVDFKNYKYRDNG